jgi:hypothetical protein
MVPATMIELNESHAPPGETPRHQKERGLLDDGLVVWASKFGRTVCPQGNLTAADYGCDYHPRAFTIWLAGGGVQVRDYDPIREIGVVILMQTLPFYYEASMKVYAPVEGAVYRNLK